MTCDGTSYVISRSGVNKSVAGEVLGAGLEYKVLNVGVKGIGSAAADRRCRVLVNTEEITHINLKSEVVALCGINKGNDPFAILREESVIFGTGTNTLLLGVIGNLLNRLHKTGEKVRIPHIALGACEGNIVTHKGSAESLGNVYLFLDSFNFFI